MHTRFIANAARAALQLFLSLAALVPFGAHAQAAYPSKPIKLVVPFAPGAVTDGSARLLAERLAQSLGQPVVVDNRPGAGGNTGTGFVAQAEPDGYTILLAPDSNMVIAPHLYKNLPYDPLKDLVPVAKFGVTSLLLVTNASSGIHTVADLVDAAKKKPGGLNYGTSGAGTNTHVVVEMLKQATGAHLTHVPYKGGSPAIADLLGGQIDFVSSTPASTMQTIKVGKLVGVAVTTLQRSSALPDVPTLIESGVNLSYNSWLGIFAPARTPAAIVQRLNSQINAAMGVPEVREKLTQMGVTANVSETGVFREEIARDLQRYGPIIRKANITLP
jgi:tripartite-type tricarboxylate transporter receptor subunit TctC